MSAKEISSLPKLKLSVNRILSKADQQKDIMTFASEIKGMGYALDNSGRLLILTNSKGYLVVNGEDLKPLIEELQWLMEESERRSWIENITSIPKQE